MCAYGKVCVVSTVHSTHTQYRHLHRTNTLPHTNTHKLPPTLARNPHPHLHTPTLAPPTPTHTPAPHPHPHTCTHLRLHPPHPPTHTYTCTPPPPTHLHTPTLAPPHRHTCTHLHLHPTPTHLYFSSSFRSPSVVWMGSFGSLEFILAVKAITFWDTCHGRQHTRLRELLRAHLFS